MEIYTYLLVICKRRFLQIQLSVVEVCLCCFCCNSYRRKLNFADTDVCSAY